MSDIFATLVTSDIATLHVVKHRNKITLFQL